MTFSAYKRPLLYSVRRESRTVHVGDVPIGSDHPIVIQSMTTPSTKDTQATVDQIACLVEAGCQIVRVTTPTMADAENLPSIRNEMKRRGVKVPLVADVHFLPQVALKACEYVEKVRINPGNFADRKKFEITEYTDQQYAEELERIRDVFVPLVRKAKAFGVAMRIGTNHGSLSDRIMNRFGDSPLGMVESALEFVRIAEDEDYNEIVLSMKASNTQVMIQAYRLLVARMDELGVDYPIHLGVTEAGDGEDGRIKSAVGIGTLLRDGIGDTIRVSLTEDPVKEIPVAQHLAALYAAPNGVVSPETFSPTWDLYSYQRRTSKKLEGFHSIGRSELVRVRTPFGNAESEELSTFKPLDPPPEYVTIDAGSKEAEPKRLAAIKDCGILLRLNGDAAAFDRKEEVLFHEMSLVASPAWAHENYAAKLSAHLDGRPCWLRVHTPSEIRNAIDILHKCGKGIEAGVEVEGHALLAIGRRLVVDLEKAKLKPPIHLRFVARSEETKEETRLRAAVELGGLFCDGIGDSIEVSSHHGVAFNHQLAFNILQATRVRLSKTEYIACPSCGRTLFDLEEVTARIRSKTNHLKGVKIAIMGCIVNGPGEMADADFGYVGSGPGHINLYVGKECVERQVSESHADQRLIELIKEHGRWVNPS